MKRFLFNCIVFSLLLIILNLMVFGLLLFHTYYEPEFHLRKKLKTYRPEVILLGDSHAGILNQDDLFPVINLGIGSDSYQDMYVKARYCLERKIPLKKVIIQCDPHCFTAYRTDMHNKGRTIVISSYQAYKEVGFAENWFDYQVQAIGTYLPIFRPSLSELTFRKAIDILEGENQQLIGESIWPLTSYDARALQSKARFQVQYGAPIERELAASFLRTVELCRQHNIEVVGLRTPLDPTYNALIPADQEIGKYCEILDSAQIEVLDFSTFFQSSNFFWDQDHVNSRGSQIIGAEIREALRL